VIAVPTPGHARGHISVVVVEADHHVLLAGDSAYAQQQLLDLQPDGVSLSATQAVASMRTILEHARMHPTVFLPSHDPDSQARLAAREPLPS
jgi:glyoxylase-like metal-dependent hydrolase (beta-lactamase superfamily II)